MSGAPNRMTRVNELLKREIANIVEREDIGGGSVLVSITGVNTSPDLRSAAVRVSIFGADEPGKKAIIRQLSRRHADIQHLVAKSVTLKYTPVLSFELDLNLESGDRVLAMLEELDNGSE